MKTSSIDDEVMTQLTSIPKSLKEATGASVPTARSHAGDGGVDIVDRECDIANARSVRRRVPVATPAGHTSPPSVRSPDVGPTS
jgi:hypothetical protein